MDSKTILHLAVESQKWDVVEFLSAKNPSSLLKGDFFRVTPLQILATTGKWDVIQSIVPFLKDSPDQLSRRDTEGKTLLQRARESGQYQLVRYLESLNVK
jgi:ankyrin repeat protein